MKLFYLIFIVLFGFSACDDLGEEMPSITLKGDTQITLKLGTYIEEAGYSATDSQDGDLTKDVNITSNIDYSRIGEYVVKYYVADKDANKATAQRTVNITADGPNSGAYANYKTDDSLYYLPSYLYDYQTLISGNSVKNLAFAYDLTGNRVANEDQNILYKQNGDAIDRISGSKTNHDVITMDEIKSYDDDDNLVSKFPIKLKVDNEYIDDDMSCHIVEQFYSFTTNSVTKQLVDGKNYLHEEVLKVVCSKNGIKTDIYYAKGKGEVLRVTDDRIILVESII